MTTRIEIDDFMSYKSEVVTLPDKGLILVTGTNGAGKSAIIEAFAAAVWGKSLRGTKTWQPGTELSVWVGRQGITRHWTNRKCEVSSLKKQPGGMEAVDFDTKTKAEEFVDDWAGPFDTWRRSSVFSSSDAFNFSTATDSERKRMLERLLGIEWIDGAYKIAREDMREQKHSLARLNDTLDSKKQELANAQEQLEFFKEQLKTIKKPGTQADAQNELSDKKRAVQSVHVETKKVQAELTEAQKAGAVELSEVARLERMLEKLGDKCPTCTQPISDDLKTRITKKMQKLEADAEEKAKEAERVVAQKQQTLDELTAERDKLKEEYVELRRLVEDHDNQVADYKRATKGKKNANLQLVDVEDDLDEILARIPKVKEDLEHMAVVDKILGLRGVRAHLLEDCLASIEANANYWLGVMASKVESITLRSYTEKKSGGTSNSIALGITGAGDGEFKGSSGGERRRVDIAILLGLAQLTASNFGPMFFDEVFDALDDDGVDGAVEALRELSANRLVMVITHAHKEALSREADTIFLVEDGRITAQ